MFVKRAGMMDERNAMLASLGNMKKELCTSCSGKLHTCEDKENQATANHSSPDTGCILGEKILSEDAQNIPSEKCNLLREQNKTNNQYKGLARFPKKGFVKSCSTVLFPKKSCLQSGASVASSSKVIYATETQAPFISPTKPTDVRGLVSVPDTMPLAGDLNAPNTDDSTLNESVDIFDENLEHNDHKQKTECNNVEEESLIPSEVTSPVLGKGVSAQNSPYRCERRLKLVTKKSSVFSNSQNEMNESASQLSESEDECISSGGPLTAVSTPTPAKVANIAQSPRCESVQTPSPSLVQFVPRKPVLSQLSRSRGLTNKKSPPKSIGRFNACLKEVADNIVSSSDRSSSKFSCEIETTISTESNSAIVKDKTLDSGEVFEKLQEGSTDISEDNMSEVDDDHLEIASVSSHPAKSDQAPKVGSKTANRPTSTTAASITTNTKAAVSQETSSRCSNVKARKLYSKIEIEDVASTVKRNYRQAKLTADSFVVSQKKGNILGEFELLLFLYFVSPVSPLLFFCARYLKTAIFAGV